MRFNAKRKHFALHAESAAQHKVYGVLLPCKICWFLAFIPSTVYMQTGNVILRTGGSETAPTEMPLLNN